MVLCYLNISLGLHDLQLTNLFLDDPFGGLVLLEQIANRVDNHYNLCFQLQIWINK